MTDGRTSSSESGYSSISGCRVDYFSFFHLRYSQSCLCEMCVFCTRVCSISCLCSHNWETPDCQKVTSWAGSKGGICGTANYTVVVFKGLKIDGSWTEPYFDINFYPVISSFLHFLPARFPPRNREALSPSAWSCPWSCDLPSHAPPLWWHPQNCCHSWFFITPWGLQGCLLWQEALRAGALLVKLQCRPCWWHRAWAQHCGVWNNLLLQEKKNITGSIMVNTE